MKQSKNWPFWLKVGSVFSFVDLLFMLVLAVPAISSGGDWEGFFFTSLFMQPLIWIFGSFEATNDLFLSGGGSALDVAYYFIIGIAGWFVIGSIIGFLLRGRVRKSVERWPLWLSFGSASFILCLIPMLFLYFKGAGLFGFSEILMGLAVFFVSGAVVGLIIQFIKELRKSF